MMQAFADDSHVHCDLSNLLASAYALEQCITAVAEWMTLPVNDS